MKRYENYKDSGVEWLGDVPSHWDMQRSKFIFKKIERKVNEEDQIVTCFRDGQVTLRANRRTEGFTNALKEHGYQGIRKGDLVIHAMDAFAGAIGISDSDGKATPVYSVCLPHNKQKIDVYFYAYYLRNLALSGFISSLAKGIRERSTDFRYADFAELLLPIPPYLEQQKIAQFLNDKTSKIDQAVDLAEKQIALLKEHKQILIQNAVTRGLNPDVPLKDSGVEWIGQVPEHWEVKKLKYLAKLSPSKSEITCNHEESCSFIPMEKLKLNTLVLDEIKQIKNVYSAYTYFRDEDLLIAKVTPCFENKNFAIAKNLVNGIGFGSSEIYILRAYNNLFNKFLFYRLQEQNFMEIAISKMSGTGGLKRVPSEFINNFQLALPPFCEQQQIADYLDKQTAKIDQAIVLKTAHIEKLREYKNVLINDVVTGKVRV